MWYKDRALSDSVIKTDNKNPLSLAIGIALIALILVGALWMMRRADARVHTTDGSSTSPAIPVETIEIEPVTLDRILKLRGFLEGIEEVTLRSEVAGRIVRRHVEDGERVAGGDLLLQIDETFYELAVQGASAELARAQAQQKERGSAVRASEAQLESARAVRANAADEFERIKKLHEGDASPTVEYHRYQTALRTAEADLAAAMAALDRAGEQRLMAQATVAVAAAALADTRARLQRCEVRSPISGRVNRFHIQPGEYAVATAPLVEVVRLDTLKMIVELSAKEAASVDKDAWGEVTADAHEATTHTARVHHVAPKMDPLSRKFRVEMRVDNAEESLLAGMYGAVDLHCGKIHGVLKIPRSAVFKHFGADFCLVVATEEDETRAALRRVTVSDILGQLHDFKVVEGLEAGDRVITTRRRELRAGSRVEVVGEHNESPER